MLLILKELYGPQGISCDANHGSQQGQGHGQHTYDGDSALGSAVVTPTSPPIFDVASSTIHPSSNSISSEPQSTAPIPLFTMAPTNPANAPPAFSYPPTVGAGSSLSVIGGRPVVDINSQPRGMDPTALPGENKPVGPPPKMPMGGFTRTPPFRR